MNKYFKLTLLLLVTVLMLTACNNKQTNETQRERINVERTEMLAILDSVKCSCVVRNNGVTTIYTQSGVRDLFELVTSSPGTLDGAHVADKIIGKGAAALMVNGGVKRATTHVITTPALKMLRDAGVEVSFEKEIPFVENRKKTGQCPLDARLQDIDDAALCMPVIELFIDDLNNGKVL